MKTYLINLDHRVDRLATAQIAIKNMGVTDYERFSAIDTRSQLEFPHDIVSPAHMGAIHRGYRTNSLELTSGAVGCYLSHMIVWETFRTSDHDVALILEDDIIYDENIDNFNRILNIAVSEIKSGIADIFLFGHTYGSPNGEQIFTAKSFLCTHSYLISKAACEQLLINALPIKHHVDCYISTLSESGLLKIRAITPQPIRQSGFDTDIQLEQPYLESLP